MIYHHVNGLKMYDAMYIIFMYVCKLYMHTCMYILFTLINFKRAHLSVEGMPTMR